MSVVMPADGAVETAEPPIESLVEPLDKQQRVMLHMPVDIRNASLAVLALLAGLVVMKWAAAVLIPLMLGLMMSYALTPLVDRLERMRVPRALGAALLLIGLVAGLASTAYWRSDDATALIEALPAAAQRMSEVVGARGSGPANAIEKVQRAANELQRAAEQRAAARTDAEVSGVTLVQVERPPFEIKEYLWSGTLGAVGLVGQIMVVCFLAYFLMASGDTFRRKIVKIAGRTLSEKKITVQALDEINQQIQRYLLIQVAASALVGIATWIAYWALGLDHAAVWGIAAGVLNLVPYLGSIVITGGSAMLGLLQFGTVEMALAVAGAALAVHVLSGYLLTPWLTGKVGRMNPVVIFAGVLAWGWLWGIWGLLLGVPILMVVKAVCDRVEDLKPVGELLGS